MIIFAPVLKKTGYVLLMLLIVLITLVLMVPALVRKPGFQQWLTEKAVSYINEQLALEGEDMEVSVEKMRFRFPESYLEILPLRFELRGVAVHRPSMGDSLVSFSRFGLTLHEIPSETENAIALSAIQLSDLRLNLDSIEGVTAKGSFQQFQMDTLHADLDAEYLEMGTFLLSAPHFDLSMELMPDTTETETSGDWDVNLNHFVIEDALITSSILPDSKIEGTIDVTLPTMIMRGDLGVQVSYAALMAVAELGVEELKQWPFEGEGINVRLTGNANPLSADFSQLWVEVPEYAQLSAKLSSHLPWEEVKYDVALGRTLETPELQARGSWNLSEQQGVVIADAEDLNVDYYVPGTNVKVEALHLDYDKGRYDAEGTILVDDLRTWAHLKGRYITSEAGFTRRPKLLETEGHVGLSSEEMGDYDSIRVAIKASDAGMRLFVAYQDALVEAETPDNFNRFLAHLGNTVTEWNAQREEGIFNETRLQQRMPKLNADICLSHNNPVSPILAQYDVKLDHADLQIVNDSVLSVNLTADSIVYDGFAFQQVRISMQPKDSTYLYRGSLFYADGENDLTYRLNVNGYQENQRVLAFGKVEVDTITNLNLHATWADSLSVGASFDRLPLLPFTAFLPDEMQMEGYLSGDARVDGYSFDLADINARLWIEEGRFHHEGTDISLLLPSDTIFFRDSQLHLNDLKVTTCNGNALHLNGIVDLRENLTDPLIDIKAEGRNLCLIDNRKTANKEQYLTGKLPANADITIKGRPSKLNVEGRVVVPDGCDLNYFYDDEALRLTSRLDDRVEFLSFETDTATTAESTANPSAGEETKNRDYLNLNLRVIINQATRVKVLLGTTKDNHLDLQGGGMLSVKMNDNRLALQGSYDIHEGDVSFKLPMLPMTEQFELAADSWVRWNGAIGNPELHLVANKQKRSTISDAATGQTRVVNFLVSVTISGNLDDMQVAFDCSAPEDAGIQSEIGSLTEEERQKQALMMLVTGNYSGPSGSANSASLSSANAALNSVLNKQIEDLLTNKLKHTEINVGIDTYDANGTGAQQTDYSLKVSQKFFNDRVKVTVGGKMSSSDEVKGNDDEIINDISVEWLIRKDGSNSLRLFRKTNYESVLEGEVVETGAGYVHKRSANRFWDLFRKRRNHYNRNYGTPQVRDRDASRNMPVNEHENVHRK